MARGYHRRQAERWRHTRLLAVTLYNAQRGPEDAVLLPEEFMPLPGDEPVAAAGQALSAEEYAAALAAVAELDNDLAP